jgi:branched-chain amino acid transport system substrate-binding protein
VYRVGFSGVQTGPNAATYAPNQESFKAYFDLLNARGGIDGHRVTVTYLDNRGEPSRALADAKRLIDEDQVTLLINNATSSTYAPMTQLVEASRVPLIFAGSAVCPQEVFPPQPDPYLFCASFNMLQTDARAIANAIQQFSGGQPVSLALIGLDVPVSHQGLDLIERQAQALGMRVVDKVFAPVGAVDYAPFAARFIEHGATWVAHWAPFDVGQGTFTALLRRGWQGSYLATAAPTAEVDTTRFAQRNFYVIPTYTFTVESLPVFAEITQALNSSGATYSVEAAASGWVAGLVVEQALRGCGWPCDRDRLRVAMEHVTVDTKGLFGGVIDWSPTNHCRSAAYYKVYAWDEAQKKIVRVRDWEKIEIR